MSLTKPANGTSAKAKAKRRAALVRHDAAESAKVRERSGGRCEIAAHYYVGGAWVFAMRCRLMATEVHHMLGGRGKRGVGISALAEHKQACCTVCHQGITGGVGGKRLRLYDPCTPPIWTDVYRSTR